MTKIAFAAGAAVIVLSGAGLMTVPIWALALAGGGVGSVFLPKRNTALDGEVSC
jgi:hypothetical protein